MNSDLQVNLKQNQYGDNYISNDFDYGWVYSRKTRQRIQAAGLEKSLKKSPLLNVRPSQASDRKWIAKKVSAGAVATMHQSNYDNKWTTDLLASSTSQPSGINYRPSSFNLLAQGHSNKN